MSVKKSAGISERKALIPAFFYDMACAMYYPPQRQTRAGWEGEGGVAATALLTWNLSCTVPS